jgi:uncharacterized protein
MVEHKSIDRSTAGTPNTAAGFVREQLARGLESNRLLHEKSPYLLQHAFNPVDWYPWGEEAFTRAAREDRPVFLSIGYSTCHWCHVMAHESFEDEATATILNQSFVCIKVDREERPDIDQIYMAATRSMSGGGGWPLSVFLTPDRRPFYAGTYFPPAPRGGMASFSELLHGIAGAWRNDRQHIMDIAGRLTEKLREMAQTGPGIFPMSKEVLATGFRQLVAEYDATYGGFSRAPKFPRPVGLNLLLRYHWRTRDEDSLAMVLHTLRSMAAGGIYDQLGGGFHRYSVDQQWRVPHFEKMLYDQSQLAISYLEAYQLTGDPLLARIARATLDYVLRDLTGSHGAFYSAEDADSPRPENPAEHSEGAFYLWTAAEIGSLLDSQEAAVFNHHFGVADNGNALTDPHGEFTGRNILYAARSPEETAQHLGSSIKEVEVILGKVSRKLFAQRNRRPRPHLDDKVITAWNGLMISALARGYQVLSEERYLKAASGAAAFVLTELHDATSGLLKRRYREGEAGLEAQLDDYAFLVQGLLDLYEASLDIWWLEQAVKLTGRQVELFADEKSGGFFDTSGRDHTVLVRMKSDYDGAEPTGNSVAAMNLLRLGWITDNREWRQRAEGTLAAFADVLSQFPLGIPQMAVAHDFHLATPKVIVIAGLPEAEDTRRMLREVQRCFLPHRILLLADGGKGQQWLAQYLPFVADIQMLEGRATAYLCENYTCKLPTDDPDRLREMLTSDQQAVISGQ